MFNDKTYELVMTILKSDLTKEDKTEIVKFYTLPRNTGVRPMIELPDEEQREQLGSITRKSVQEIYDEEHPEEKEEKEAIKSTLKGMVK